MANTKKTMTPRVGDVWEDNDPRMVMFGERRRLKIVAIHDDYAVCRVVKGVLGWERPFTVVKLNRFKPNCRGYRLVRRGRVRKKRA